MRSNRVSTRTSVGFLCESETRYGGRQPMGRLYELQNELQTWADLLEIADNQKAGIWLKGLGFRLQGFVRELRWIESQLSEQLAATSKDDC